MNDLEQQLNQLLSDPETLGTIAQLAQSLGGGSGSADEAVLPDLDQLMGMLGNLSAGGSPNSPLSGLVQALGPLVSPAHCQRLERAVRMGSLAALVLGNTDHN